MYRQFHGKLCIYMGLSRNSCVFQNQPLQKIIIVVARMKVLKKPHFIIFPNGKEMRHVFD